MESIDHYVPHRGAMCLIDELIEADDERAVATAQVPEGGLLIGEDGRMPTWATIEHMAQTVAAWAGARARRQGRPVGLGFLLGTRRLQIHQPSLAAGSRLRVDVCCEMIAANGLGMFECEVSADGQPVSSAFVSVFEPEDASVYLAQAAAGGEA
jgi:predicted hotdog family 3-hydroxylacyl-ACP dehydratase